MVRSSHCARVSYFSVGLFSFNASPFRKKVKISTLAGMSEWRIAQNRAPDMLRNNGPISADKSLTNSGRQARDGWYVIANERPTETWDYVSAGCVMNMLPGRGNTCVCSQSPEKVRRRRGGRNPAEIRNGSRDVLCETLPSRIVWRI